MNSRKGFSTNSEQSTSNSIPTSAAELHQRHPEISAEAPGQLGNGRFLASRQDTTLEEAKLLQENFNARNQLVDQSSNLLAGIWEKNRVVQDTLEQADLKLGISRSVAQLGNESPNSVFLQALSGQVSVEQALSQLLPPIEQVSQPSLSSSASPSQLQLESGSSSSQLEDTSPTSEES